MQEKDMVMDVLSGTKSSIGSYAKIITECSNQTLRQKFQQMRDSDEQFQYNLYKVAEQKGYYQAAPAAQAMDMQSVKSSLSTGMTQIGGAQQSDVPPGLQ